VRYETAKAFRTALEQRLKNEAQATGIALIRLRKRVAFERFLVRLATSESSGWVLKGAFALELRLGLRTRTTKDIDLGRADDEEGATGHLNAATGIDLGDFFEFEVRRTAALDAATGTQGYAAICRSRALLARSARNERRRLDWLTCVQETPRMRAGHGRRSPKATRGDHHLPLRRHRQGGLGVSPILHQNSCPTPMGQRF
jgi:hypothetical protein